MDFFKFLVPKVHWSLKNMRQKFQKYLLKIKFLMLPAFCDQVVVKLVDESCTGKRNLKVSLDIVREKCT